MFDQVPSLAPQMHVVKESSIRPLSTRLSEVDAPRLSLFASPYKKSLPLYQARALQPRSSRTPRTFPR